MSDLWLTRTKYRQNEVNKPLPSSQLEPLIAQCVFVL